MLTKNGVAPLPHSAATNNVLYIYIYGYHVALICLIMGCLPVPLYPLVWPINNRNHYSLHVHKCFYLFSIFRNSHEGISISSEVLEMKEGAISIERALNVPSFGLPQIGVKAINFRIINETCTTPLFSPGWLLILFDFLLPSTQRVNKQNRILGMSISGSGSVPCYPPPLTPVEEENMNGRSFSSLTSLRMDAKVCKYSLCSDLSLGGRRRGGGVIINAVE